MESPQTSIEDLPVGVLTKILSFLPLITAVQCSAVALPWRNLWHKLPVINFTIPKPRDGEPERPLRVARNLILKMLTHSLFNSPDQLPVKKFKVSFTRKNYESAWTGLDLWLHRVIKSKASELDLDFSEVELKFFYLDSDDEEEEEDWLESYKFNYVALLNSSVRVLRLTCCDLIKPSSAYYDKMYHSLREIHLTEVYHENEEIQHLVNSCVNLEVLNLEFVGFGKECKIVSKSLKVFRVNLPRDYNDYWVYSVEILAPKLETLGLNYAHDGKYVLKDASSLVEADVIFPRRGWKDFAGWSHMLCSLGSVKRLRIQNMWLRSLFGGCEKRREELGQVYQKFQPAEEVFSENFVFSNLKHVELLTGFSEDDIHGLEMLLKICPQLETMVLVNEYNFSDDFKGVEVGPISFQIPHLKLVEMKEFQETESELFVAGLLKKHGVVLDKVVAYPKRVEGESELPYIL